MYNNLINRMKNMTFAHYSLLSVTIMHMQYEHILKKKPKHLSLVYFFLVLYEVPYCIIPSRILTNKLSRWPHMPMYATSFVIITTPPNTRWQCRIFSAVM